MPVDNEIANVGTSNDMALAAQAVVDVVIVSNNAHLGMDDDSGPATSPRASRSGEVIGELSAFTSGNSWLAGT